ncbi:uncharacterized protein LOC131665341 [Phymastichus coffea]|uniref:uncharacterized protein LOC131665341 n=1 Tax=Phymastichus coffea TaxID=108790 RepID=UPI00273A763B|nr:uncharacterized protein LOC131665341 [Phymastichus coffea]XP_058793169.1 uncharacterized protein LOC131665341 [Phymastichus coffea]
MDTVLKLQHLAMVSIGQYVWQTAPIKCHIKELFTTKNERNCETSRYLDWVHIMRAMYNKLQQNYLPARLTCELLYVVKQMGDRMYEWYHYVERTDNFLHDKCGQTLEHPGKLYWLPSCAIDVQRVISENWIRNVRLENACAAYFVSIIHGLDNNLTDVIWSSMSDELRNTCRQILSSKESYASAFLYTSIGSPQESLKIARELGFSTIAEDQRFFLFVRKGYLELVKSVWYGLSHSTRNSIVDKGFRLALRLSSFIFDCTFEKRRFEEIALFLYCQMSDQCRHSILCNSSYIHYIAKVLYIIASKPHLDLLMPTLEVTLTYILDDLEYIYSDLVISLTYDMLEDFDCTYVPRGTLVKVWRRIPDKIKRKIQFCDVIRGLVNEWDLISLRILFNIPEFDEEKNELMICLVNSYLKLECRERFDKLNELVENVFISDSDIDDFKRRVQDCKTINILDINRDY